MIEKFYILAINLYSYVDVGVGRLIELTSTLNPLDSDVGARIYCVNTVYTVCVGRITVIYSQLG